MTSSRAEIDRLATLVEDLTKSLDAQREATSAEIASIRQEYDDMILSKRVGSQSWRQHHRRPRAPQTGKMPQPVSRRPTTPPLAANLSTGSP